MHNSQWECEHVLEDDSCNMLQNNALSIALDSLYDKNLLNRVRKDKHFVYSFKW